MATSTEDKTADLIDYVDKLVTFNEEQETSNELVGRLLNEKFAEFQFSIECKLENFLSTVTAKLNQIKAAKSSSGAVIIAADESSEPQSQDWEAQRKSILEEYGFEEGSEEAKTVDAKLESTDSENIAEETVELDKLHNSIDSIASVDSSEIDELKEMLTSKLRDAEVELSIGRAKLSQQMAALELKQHELNQREANLEGTYGRSEDGSKKKPSILDRFSRHMTKRKPEDK